MCVCVDIIADVLVTAAGSSHTNASKSLDKWYEQLATVAYKYDHILWRIGDSLLQEDYI